MIVLVLAAAGWISVAVLIVAVCTVGGRFDAPAAAAQASSTTAAPSARQGP